MGNFEIFLIGAGIFAVLVALASVLVKAEYFNSIKKIAKSLQQLKPESEFKVFGRDEIYHIEICDSHLKYLLKIVKSKAEYEFIITNSEKWIVNQSPQQWTRKTKPIFIDNSKEFIDLKDEVSNLVKIVVIYPSCKRIIHYLNESDTVIVKEEDKVNGIHFVRYENVEKFIKNQ